MASIALLDHVQRARLDRPGRINHHVDKLRRESRPVSRTDDIGRGNTTPTRICHGAVVDSQALRSDLRRPFFGFIRGEIVEEDVLSIFGRNVDNALL